ncbi:MAG: SpoIID/LytB domain-containing protein [Dokdonella sp.]
MARSKINAIACSSGRCALNGMRVAETRGMSFKLRRFLIAMLLSCVSVPVAAVDIAVRDSQTGAPIEAKLTAKSLSDRFATLATQTLSGGSIQIFPLAVGRWQLDLSAAGYRELQTTIESEGSDALPLTILLDPIAPSASLIEVERLARSNPAHAWLHGYVRRVDDAMPIVSARISGAGSRTVSDSNGHFVLDLGEVSEHDTSLADAFELLVEADGFAPHALTRLLRTAGLQQRLVSLGNGAPDFRVNEIGARDQRLSTPLTAMDQSPAMVAQPMSGAATLLAPPLTPPASIRVGYADLACTTPCCTASCSNVCTLSLETYVRRGLDSEWIASWNTQSLRAGSIAYRSYGTWRVQNPIRAEFDICSSACCQVNDAGTSASTDAAVARTPGILLTRNGSSAFSAEYSAENNSWDDPNDGLSCSNVDLSCGNGNVGSPATGWPCLADAVALNRGCFGHGRGMSQWGTQRWAIDATQRRWKWIVDHYYNDNGNQTGAGTGQRNAQMTSPLVLTSLNVTPSSIAPGDTVSISAIGTNAAGAEHAHLLIGASLYRSGVGFLDDPSHDIVLSLAAGSHPIQRDFAVPSMASVGGYDVLLSLYLDVDEDGSISSADQAMALLRVDGALTIAVLPDQIFFDGFEISP